MRGLECVRCVNRETFKWVIIRLLDPKSNEERDIRSIYAVLRLVCTRWKKIADRYVRVDPKMMLLETLSNDMQYGAIFFLNNHSASFDYTDRWTALQYSVNHNHVELLRFMLNCQNMDPAYHNNICIYNACARGNHDVVSVLISDIRVDPSHQVSRAQISRLRVSFTHLTGQ
jgi:hypothetical protein